MPFYLGPSTANLAFSGTTGVSAALIQLNEDRLTVKPSGLGQLTRTYACPAANAALARQLLVASAAGATGFSPADYPNMWLFQRPKETNDGALVRFECDFYGVVSTGDWSAKYVTYSSTIAQAVYSEGNYRATYSSPIQNLTFVMTAGTTSALVPPSAATLAANALGVSVSGGVPQFQFFDCYADGYYVRNSSTPFSVTGTLYAAVRTNTPVTLGTTAGFSKLIPTISQVTGGGLGTGTVVSVSGATLQVSTTNSIVATSSSTISVFNPSTFSVTGYAEVGTKLLSIPLTLPLGLNIFAGNIAGNYISTYLTGTTSVVSGGVTFNYVANDQTGWSGSPAGSILTLGISIGVASGATGNLPSGWPAVTSGTATIGVNSFASVLSVVSTSGMSVGASITGAGVSGTITNISGLTVSVSPAPLVSTTATESLTVTPQSAGYVTSYFNTVAGSSVNLVISNRTNYGMIDEIQIGWQLMVNNT
jgi:hypothetical protein